MKGSSNIVIRDERPPKIVGISEVPENTFFTGDVGGIRSLFLKTFERVVQISAEQTMTCSNPNTPVRDYQPVNVEIVIKENVA